ncbi:MAG: AzlC family ABC transporter permease [Bacillota bacterium]
MSRLREGITGFVQALPVGLSVFAYGLAYGSMARQAGLSCWETVLMSAAVFAGSAQFAAINMLKAGASPASIVLTTFTLNSRHLLMGASLRFGIGKATILERLLLAHFLTDESYALAVHDLSSRHHKAAYFVGVGSMIFVAWVSSSVLSAALGELLPESLKYGLGFSFLGVFASLIVGHVKDMHMALALVVAAATALIAGRRLPSGLVVLVATLAAICVGLVIDRREVSDASSNSLDGPCHLRHKG